MEVERWIAEDRPTEYLPIQPSQIIHTHFHGPVTGSAVILNSTDTTVNLQAAVGESLPQLIAKATQLLAEWQGDEDEREDIAADIELLDEQTGGGTAPPGRIKAALRRIAAWAGVAAAVGASSAISGEVQQLAGDVLQHP